MSDDRQELSAMKQLARAEFRAERYASAEQIFENILATEPRNPYTKGYIAMCEQKMGNSDRALGIARESAEESPELAWPNGVCGYILMALERASEAEPYFRAAVRAKPDSVHDMMELANCLLALERRVEAAELASSAIKLDPDNARARSILADALRPSRIKTARDFTGALKLQMALTNPHGWSEEKGALAKASRVWRGSPRSRLLFSFLGPFIALALGAFGNLTQPSSAAGICLIVLTASVATLYVVPNPFDFGSRWRVLIRSRKDAVLWMSAFAARACLVCAAACFGWGFTMAAVGCAVGYLLMLAVGSAAVSER